MLFPVLVTGFIHACKTITFFSSLLSSILHDCPRVSGTICHTVSAFWWSFNPLTVKSMLYFTELYDLLRISSVIFHKKYKLQINETTSFPFTLVSVQQFFQVDSPVALYKGFRKLSRKQTQPNDENKIKQSTVKGFLLCHPQRVPKPCHFWFACLRA